MPPRSSRSGSSQQSRKTLFRLPRFCPTSAMSGIKFPIRTRLSHLPSTTQLCVLNLALPRTSNSFALRLCCVRHLQTRVYLEGRGCNNGVLQQTSQTGVSATLSGLLCVPAYFKGEAQMGGLYSLPSMTAISSSKQPSNFLQGTDLQVPSYGNLSTPRC